MRYNVQIYSATDKHRLFQTMRDIGVTPEGAEIMAPKGQFYCLRVSGLSGIALSLLKQEMLAKGGEAALPRHAALLNEVPGDALLMGTTAQFQRLLEKLLLQPFGLSELASEISEAFKRFNNSPRPLTIGDKTFQWGSRTYVMGIINMTPDSFSGDGLGKMSEDIRFQSLLAQVDRFQSEGTDILDIGGESTRPGAETVEAEEEKRRVVPVVRILKSHTMLPISVDTQKAVVAEAALEQGAHIINDIWGLQGDPAMARVIGAYGAGIVVMHNKNDKTYTDLMGEIISFLDRSINIALKNNIPQEKIWVDPGIGFGKTREQNLEVIDRLHELRVLGCPILLGTSRKSVIGLTLDLPVEERLEGTAATVAIGIARGTDIIRVHDIKSMVRTAKMTDAIVRRGVEHEQRI